MSKRKHYKIKTISNTTSIRNGGNISLNYEDYFDLHALKNYFEGITEMSGTTLESEMQDSKHKIAMINYLVSYYKECLDNAQNTLELVNNLSHIPSNDSLSELELLNDFVKECYDDAIKRFNYEKNYLDFVRDIINK